jgi:hypothetical protein
VELEEEIDGLGFGDFGVGQWVNLERGVLFLVCWCFLGWIWPVISDWD